MIRYLIISLFALFLLNACKPFRLEGQQQTEVRDTVINPYFSDYQDETLFRGRIEVYGKVITGLFVAKRIGEEEHRMVFTSDFGNTLFDFTITPSDFQVNYVMDDLNKKIILNILKRDFTTLVKIKNPIERRLESSANWGYESIKDKRYFVVDKENGQLHQIVIFSKYKRKVDIDFHTDQNMKLNKIEIAHQNIDLKITLTI